MAWKTKLTELLSIDYPIIQGGMAYISDGVLAAAMAHAGCAGVIGSGGFTTDEVRDNIRRARDILGPKGIYGVNLMLQAPNKDDVAQVICDEKVPFVTLGAGNPVPWFDDLHHAGVKCIPVVPNVKLAKRVQDAAALIMGASGVQMGTRFLLAEECRLHPKAKEAIIKAKDTDSTVTGFTTGDSVRGIKNAFSEKYLKAEYSGAPLEELIALATGTTRKGAVEGDTENGFVLAGMSLTHLTKIQPVEEIVEELVSETERRLAGAKGLI